ncbi:MAG: hypothetical protein ACLPVF_16010 [Acidimicrobiales bacterium]
MDQGATILPGSLPQAVRIEFGRAFHAPYEVPVVVAVNGILMAGLWFFAPKAWDNALFSLHGTLAFPLVMAGWMMSDVPASNVLGPDQRRVRAALDDPTMFRRLLHAKNVVLWALVIPLCMAITLGVALSDHDYIGLLVALVTLAVIPFGPLAISAWVGIRFPYHPIPLRERWEHRRSWRHFLFRWAALALTPYGLVPMLATAMVTPTLLLWGIAGQHGLRQRLSDSHFAWGLLLACAISVVVAVIGYRGSGQLARRRKAKLSAYLADPSLG